MSPLRAGQANPHAIQQEPARHRLPGEFEHQDALLIASAELCETVPDFLVEILRSVQGHIPVLVMVNGAKDQMEIRRILNRHGVRPVNIRFLVIPHDTMWVRDYGPFVVDRPGLGPAVLDPAYSFPTRDNDETVPSSFARKVALPIVQTSLILEGGNLLSNGEGICVATTGLIALNEPAGLQEDGMRAMLSECLGADPVVFVEPLLGEDSGHVDMFATFLSRDTIVVGEYSVIHDRTNKDVLDRNARLLASVKTPRGALRVVRIPMPPAETETWRTYTNVVYANGVLLVPVYPDVDEKGRRIALALYAKLLPGWRIVPIDASDVAKFGGTLHCVTMNLGPAWKARARFMGLNPQNP